MFARSVFAAALMARAALANIYATYPVADSVLSANYTVTVRWVDDKGVPTLPNMGPVKIELYSSTEHVATLAENVDPNARSADVWISSAWGHNGSDYHMRFVCARPETTAYTADFTIAGMAGTSSPGAGKPHGHAANDSSSATDSSTAHPGRYSTSRAVTLVRPSETVYSTQVRAPAPATALHPTGTAPSIGNLEDAKGHAEDSSAGALVKRPFVDLARLEFRLAVVLWPTVIGISMAL